MLLPSVVTPRVIGSRTDGPLRRARAGRDLTELRDDTVGVSGRLDGLRETNVEQGDTWELRVQLCTDLDRMPVEDASFEWDEKESPYRTLGRITVAPQFAWAPERAKVVHDQTYFSHWEGPTAQQPLVSVNCSRRRAYGMSAEYRAQFNGCTMHEPVVPGALLA